MNENTTVPKSYWVISVLGLLWNLIGGAAFAGYKTADAAALKEMGPGYETLFASLPGWYDIVFGAAVVTGILGCIALLLRKSWALPLLVISLIAVLVQQGAAYGMFNAKELLPSYEMYLAIAVVVVGALLIWFANSSKSKGYLN